MKDPAEHRLHVQTKAEREFTVNLWAQRGQKHGKECIQLMLHDFNLCAIKQIEQIKITMQHLPSEQMLFIMDVKQLPQFTENLINSKDESQARLFRNTAVELSPMQLP